MAANHFIVNSKEMNIYMDEMSSELFKKIFQHSFIIVFIAIVMVYDLYICMYSIFVDREQAPSGGSLQYYTLNTCTFLWRLVLFNA